MFKELAQMATPANPAQSANAGWVLVLFGVFAISAIILFGAFAIYIRAKHGNRRRPGSDPACGKCGYAGRGLTTFVCPECGADLREVGIIPAAKQKSAKTASAAAPTASATRTVTIMLTDMQDYTSRAENSSRDDALSLIRRHRDIVQPIVQRRAGRIIKSTGDGLIAAFDSATDALLAGIDVQTAIALNNSQSFTEQNKFQLRIAVSTGEVAFVEDDVFGQPVNLASRVQQLAQPGDVYFTDATFHAMNRKEINAESIGPVEIKGVTGTINLYRCILPVEKAAQVGL
jgi:class 3 adenylate cyclase